MATYKELQAQIAQLQKEAREMRAKEVQAAINQIRVIMNEFGLAVEDLHEDRAAKDKKPQLKAEIKFRDGDNIWSGRGRTPLWLKDKNREKYRVR